MSQAIIYFDLTYNAPGSHHAHHSGGHGVVGRPSRGDYLDGGGDPGEDDVGGRVYDEDCRLIVPERGSDSDSASGGGHVTGGRSRLGSKVSVTSGGSQQPVTAKLQAATA